MKKSILSDFAQSPTFLPEIYDKTYATALGTFDAFFDGVNEIGLACANIRSKHVRAVTCRVLVRR